MNTKEIEALARKAAKGVKTEADVATLSSTFRKVLLETMLEAEMDDHLGYSKHEQSERGNNRNGHSVKRLRTSEEEISLATPRDRDGSFEPAI